MAHPKANKEPVLIGGTGYAKGPVRKTSSAPRVPFPLRGGRSGQIAPPEDLLGGPGTFTLRRPFYDAVAVVRKVARSSIYLRQYIVFSIRCERSQTEPSVSDASGTGDYLSVNWRGSSPAFETPSAGAGFSNSRRGAERLLPLCSGGASLDRNRESCCRRNPRDESAVRGPSSRQNRSLGHHLHLSCRTRATRRHLCAPRLQPQEARPSALAAGFGDRGSVAGGGPPIRDEAEDDSIASSRSAGRSRERSPPGELRRQFAMGSSPMQWRSCSMWTANRGRKAARPA